MTTVSAPSSTFGNRSWEVSAALIALGEIPVLAGSARFVELAGGPELLPGQVRPLIHTGGHAQHQCYRLRRLGRRPVLPRSVAMQTPMAPGRRPPAHAPRPRRRALSAVADAISPRTEGGDLLYLFRLLAGSGMAVSLVVGYTAIRRRNVVRHAAWMTRAPALALGAGTKVFHHRYRRSDLRGQRPQRRPAAGCGLGHQPRGRRVGHPPTPEVRSTSRAVRS